MELGTNILAENFRCPVGKAGEEVGRRMAKINAEANLWTLDLLEIKTEDSVLEIGFGPGEALAEVADRASSGHIAGVDFSEVMLRAASLRNASAIQAGLMTLSLADTQSLPFPSAQFNKVFGVNLAYFWEEPEKHLAEAFRVLKNTGRLALYFLRTESLLPGLMESGHFSVVEKEALSNSMCRVGFSDVRSFEKSLPHGQGVCVVGEKM